MIRVFCSLICLTVFMLNDGDTSIKAGILCIILLLSKILYR